MSRNNEDNIFNRYTEACIQCGACLEACDLLSDLGMSLGDIANAMLGDQINPEIQNAIVRCSLCGLCCMGCPVNLQPVDLMVAAREALIKNGQISVDDYQAMLVDQDWNFFTIYRDTYGITYKDLERSKYDTLFFPGCTLASYSPELTSATYDWLNNQGIKLGFTDLCCGKPLSSIGLVDRTKHLHNYIARQMKAAGASRLITACPNCMYQLKGFLPGIEVISLYDLLISNGLILKGNERLSVHDSCPDRYDMNIGENVRQLLSGYSLTEMEHHGQNTICCGSGGIVSMIDPELCEERANIRMKEWEDTHTEKCVTSCMACAHRLARASLPGNVIHVLEMIFNIKVDYTQIDHNARMMWEGEQGQKNLDRLSNSRLIAGIMEASRS